MGWFSRGNSNNSPQGSTTLITQEDWDKAEKSGIFNGTSGAE